MMGWRGIRIWRSEWQHEPPCLSLALSLSISRRENGMETQVKCCATCGYFSVRRGGANAGPALVAHEVTPRVRSDGQLFVYEDGEGTYFPSCTRGVANLSAELSKHTSQARNPAKALEWMNAAHPDCHEWVHYRPGMSPESHLQEALRERAEADRRRYELQLEKGRRRFEMILFGLTVAISLVSVVVGVWQVAIANSERNDRLQRERQESLSATSSTSLDSK